MKYVLIVGDGMADLPMPDLDGKTPLEALELKGMARLAGGVMGRVRTCPNGLPPGSDVAFLTLLGYDPLKCYTGRSPLEAAGLGVSLLPGEVALRMNLVTLSNEGYPDAKVLSHNGSGIDGEPARTLVNDLLAEPSFAHLLSEAGMRVYPTNSFRHIAVMRGCTGELSLTPPHDLAGRRASERLQGHPVLARMMEESFRILRAHPMNAARREAGLAPVNSVWFWGAGTACVLESFEKKYGVRGAAVSAVPLVKGIARLSGMRVCEVSGANGLLDTNYRGKLDAAMDALSGDCDFALIHLEAADEMSHDGSLRDKMEAIRRLDERIVLPLMERMDRMGDYRAMIMADHYTLVSTRTHDGTPVPYAIFDSRVTGEPRAFTEANCAGYPVIEDGDTLLRKLFES